MKGIVAVMISALILFVACRSSYPVTEEQFTIKKSEVNLENGKNLAFNVCGQCHYNYHVKSFIGKEMRDLPGFMGRIYSSNLTNGHALAKYNDAQLFYLIKTGIAHDGRFIPYMIRPTIADKDLKDIIAYLRTSDAPLKKNDSVVGRSKISFLGRLATKIGAKPQPYQSNPKPVNNPVAQGRYLVDIVGCYHCHSKSILGLNYTNPEASKGYMAGGMRWKIDANKVWASNITPDVSTGIGEYDTVSFRNAVREGIGLNGLKPEGRPLQYPMPHFKRLTDKQVDAIFTYMNSLQSIHNKVKGH